MKPEVLTGPLPSRFLPPVRLDNCTKKDILEYFENSYSLDEWLFTSIKDESYFYMIPDKLRLPLIFYYGHTAVVYVNKLILGRMLKERVDQKMETVLETGVDEMAWDDPSCYRLGGSITWPSLSDVREYRRKVRDVVRSLILTSDLDLPVDQGSRWWSLWMGIEHQRVHMETSSVLIRQLPLHMLENPLGWVNAPLTSGAPVMSNPLLPQEGGLVNIGKDPNLPLWGWDNAYGSLAMKVPDFEASKYLTSNREMLEFVQAGGYNQQSYWSEEGWHWKEYCKARHPIFWICDKNCPSRGAGTVANMSQCSGRENGPSNDVTAGYLLRLMFSAVGLPLDFPVEVNHHEARAFCAWKGNHLRLCTEAEHSLIRDLPQFTSQEPSTDPIYSTDASSKINFNLKFGSSSPVDFYPPSLSGFHDSMGNVWQWLEDDLTPLPGFKSHELYSDFSTNAFDGDHAMMAGGSWISSGTSASRFYRVGFRRHFMQHAGFRVCRSLGGATPIKVARISKETEKGDFAPTLSPLCTPIVLSPPGDAHEELKRVIHQEISSTEIYSRIVSLADADVVRRTLVVGCGSGRLAMQLSKHCEVVGCDTSAQCIELANKLKNLGCWGLTASDAENGFFENKTENIEELAEANPENISFKQLSWLPCELVNFDLIVNLNLDRCANPKAWLNRMDELVGQTKQGKCVVVSQKYKAQQIKDDFDINLSLVSSQQVGHASLTVWASQDY